MPEADGVLKRAVTLEPGRTELVNLCGVVAVNLGRLADGCRWLRRAVAGLPDFPDARGNLAVTLHMAGDEWEAARQFRALLALRPDHPLGVSRLGELCNAGGDLDAAVRLLRRAAWLDPHGRLERVNLASALTGAGRLDAADAALRRARALDPGDAGAWAQAGGVCLMLGRTAAAHTAFLRALRVDPASGDAARGVERCARYRRAAAAAWRPETPAGVLVRGPYSGVSGYSHMINRFVDTIAAAGRPIEVIGLFGDEDWGRPALGGPVRAGAIVNMLIPAAVEPVPGLAAVNFSMFEGTRIPPAWRRFNDRHDLVIVPTEASRLAWVEGGFPADRVRVCPLGVDAQPPSGPTMPMEALGGRPIAAYRHRLLNVSDFIPRKNVDGLLRVWLRSTRANDDAVLILKLGKGSPRTRAELDALVRRTERAVGRRFAEAAPIAVIDRTLSEEAMESLFRAATHYISLSHGEGWDLPMSKAGALGLQLIAPRHSAYVDYLDDRVARMIPATVGPARRPYSDRPWAPFFGLDWWEPDEDAAAEIVGRVVRGEDDRRLDARTHLLDRFTWSHAAARLLHILGSVAP